MGLAEKYGDTAEFDDYVNSQEFKNHYTAGVDVSWFPDFELPKRSHEIENVYEEIGHGYQEIPYSPNLCIKGFWQSEKYFSHIREKLQTTFRIPNETISGTIAIHYRRGDFYLYPDLFPILPSSYFIQALGMHYDFNEHQRVIVFSDEIESCKKIFSKYNFEYSENKNPIQDFYAMCRCENFIISNSAFSWMAAWLSRSQKKIVICPEESKWYGKSGMDTKDLLPDEWIKI
jgi:glycosyltransferase involved in cell wall biosynthesis